MAYKEPGVYLRLVTNPKYATGYLPSLIPMVLGSGPRVLERTVVITRATEGNEDFLPNEALNILSVGVTSRRATFFQNTPAVGVDGEPGYVPAATKDFSHSEGDDSIVWEAATENKPAPGDNYYVTYVYDVDEDPDDDSQYRPRLIFSLEEIRRYYGTDIRHHEAGQPLNRLAIAATIMLEAGANVIYMMQIPPNASGDVTAIQYRDALAEKAMFFSDIYRMVPVDLDVEVNSVMDAHVEFASSYEERLERCVMYGRPQETPPADFLDVYDTVGEYALSKNYKRISIPYPDRATKMLSDGNFYELDAPFLCAAFAGRESFHPVYRSKTRDKFTMFNTLVGIPMLRKQQNMLAERGTMILNQPYGPGTDIIVRHALTTEMMSVQTRETSIVMIGDFVSKYLRYVCEQYIGKYNITEETLARIKATLEGALYKLKKEGVVTHAAVTKMLQDEYNPDTLLIDLRIKPPYPCNYIEITLYLD